MEICCDKLQRIIDEIFNQGLSAKAHVLCAAFSSTPADPTAAVPFLRSRKQLGAFLSGGERESLTIAIKTLENSLANPSQFYRVQQALGFEYPDAAQRRELTKQLHHRLLGLLYGILTAALCPEQHQFKEWEFSGELGDALNACGNHWDAAWWFPIEDTYADGYCNGVAAAGRVDALLMHASATKSLRGNWRMHPGTWLTVRRLLMYLLESPSESQPVGKCADAQVLPVLWVRRFDDVSEDQQSEGVVRGILIEMCSASRAGWFADPVRFGITVFDRDLQGSVEIAGRLAWPRLRDTGSSISIGPGELQAQQTSGSWNLLLSGASAGGLLGCGMYALINRQTITRGLTASVSLRLKAGVDLQPTETHINIDDVVCAGVSGATAKLSAATAAGLKGVALHSDNQTEAEDFRTGHAAPISPPEITSTFSQLHRYLTRGFQIDQLVAAESQVLLDRWKRARKGEPLEGERHQLDVFVKPRLSVCLLRHEHGKGQPEEKWETLPRGVKSLLDRYFIPSDQWLVITEDAGGGKTVLSWLLAAALSGHAERFWVVRYEGRFPEDLRKDLEQRLQSKLSAAGITQTAHEVLDDLLTQRRVVVIYDALDQDNSSTAVDRIHALRHSNPDECLKTGLRLIVTSRPYAVNQHHTSVFQLADWRHCRLELFDEGHQTDYREQVHRLAESRKAGDGARVEIAYGQLLSDPEAVADLLAYPVVQALIRSIIESQLGSNGTGTLRPFRNAGDLYWEVANRLLDRSFKSMRYAETLSRRAKLLLLLSCYGYLMMLKYRDYRVPQREIATMHASVRDRCNVSENDWKDYEGILQDTAVTEHLLLKENAERELSFPSLKMAEFFAGLYLGRYCDERVIQELQPEIGKGEWNNVWRFVAELPETTDSSGKTVCSVVSMSHSLLALFAVPDSGKRRPTESMFRAWQVLTRNDWLSEVREQVLEGWRQQFRRILIEGYEQGQPSQRARTAAEVVFEGDLKAFVESAVDPELARLRPRLDDLEAIKRPDRQQKAELQKLTAQYAKLEELSEEQQIEQWCQQLRPSFDTYALCSDAKKGDPKELTFMMGASAEDQAADKERETPWQEVIVPAFYMATTCVTRAQYALFDPQRDQEDSDLPEYAPAPDCPMISVNFHDGICFALWLDDSYSLPSEVQWEGAAWGGLDREQHLDYVIGVPPFTAGFTSAEVNFEGTEPLQGPKSKYRRRTVPVRFAEFQPNGFGLWQMSGNVYEYTRSEFHEGLQDAIEHREDNLACGSAEAIRCVRGGSWRTYAWGTRCSDRIGEFVLTHTGIRLSRTK